MKRILIVTVFLAFAASGYSQLFGNKDKDQNDPVDEYGYAWSIPTTDTFIYKENILPGHMQVMYLVNAKDELVCTIVDTSVYNQIKNWLQDPAFIENLLDLPPNETNGFEFRLDFLKDFSLVPKSVLKKYKKGSAEWNFLNTFNKRKKYLVVLQNPTSVKGVRQGNKIIPCFQKDCSAVNTPQSGNKPKTDTSGGKPSPTYVPAPTTGSGVPIRKRRN